MGPNDYVLLELLDRLGGVQGRKKLQKLAYMAKLAGAPLEDEFYFHFYGPYSSELASRVDRLAEYGFLNEGTRPLPMANGVEYDYKLTEKALAELVSIRPKVPADFCKRLQHGIDAVAGHAESEVMALELAATLLYWQKMGHSPDEAETITEQGKKVLRDSGPFEQARKIAEAVSSFAQESCD